MTTPKTTNLGLNKVDRTSPETTTFNTKTLIDDNADLLDAKFGADASGHKHDGTAGNGPKLDSASLADGAATDAVIGNRTISDTAAPTGDTAKPSTLFGWLANMVKQITGKASWRTPPAITLEAAKVEIDAIRTKADQAFQQASDGKSAVAAAITGMGQAAAAGDTFAQLAGKVKEISKDATASSGDVLDGKSFYQGGLKRSGTIRNKGGGASFGSGDGSDANSLFFGSANNMDVGRLDFTVPAAQSGYYPAGTPINLHIKGLLPWMFRADVKVGGANGMQGTIPVRVGAHTTGTQRASGALSGDGKNYAYIMPAEGYYDGSDSWAKFPEPDLLPENWRADKTIFGKAGTVPVYLAGSQPNTYAYRKSSLPGKFYVTPLWGHYDEGVEVAYTDPNFIAENIKAGVSMLGVLGSFAGGKKSATGTVVGSGLRMFLVDIWSFQPSLMVWYFTGTNGLEYVGVWGNAANEFNYLAHASLSSSSATNWPLTDASVTNSGFNIRLTALSLGQTIRWFAYE